jgi:hypothetical protein
MGVKVQNGYGPVQLGHDPQQRQGDRVVAAHADEPGASPGQQTGTGLDLAHGLLDVERVAGDIAGVGDLLARERPHLELGVIGTQEPRGLPDVSRPETGSGPVGRPAVERHSDDDDIGAVDLVQLR